MYAVIFKAKINKINRLYFEMADAMRELAIKRYGCIEFTSVTEGDNEIAISYWKNRKDIEAWKEDKEHKKAQALGKRQWYKSYHVQITEVLHEYSST
jgi:heme-degrading monooxygenase HmoA